MCYYPIDRTVRCNGEETMKVIALETLQLAEFPFLIKML